MTSDGAAQRKAHTAEDAQEVPEPASTSSAESREQTNRVMEESDEILDEIDAVLKAGLGLDKDASDEEFAERASMAVANYQQKGGQ